MWRYPVTVVTIVGVLAVVLSARARPIERFILQDHDQLIVEAPGCYAACGIQTPTRRECAVREPDCHVVCQPIPECKPDGIRPIQVCAIVRDAR